MDYTRKKHWVTYKSAKCKMYLRNDFRFTCAYCGMKEWDNIAGESIFEKDHFLAKSVETEMQLDNYDNMVYACCKCNRTKTDKNISLALDPCKDDIYGGEVPAIEKLGLEDEYRLKDNTPKGRMFIDSLQLNSRFYRKMREKQEKNDEIRKLIHDLLKEKSADYLTGRIATLKSYLEDSVYFDEKSDEFRCGFSKAGEDIFNVLEILDKKKIEYKLVFEDDDLDVVISFYENTYNCEIKVSDYIGEHRRAPIVALEKKRIWLDSGRVCGILYYYKNMNILELYVYCDEKHYEKYEL